MRGSCLCGQVVFEIERFVPHTTHCHCLRCRKSHGAAYATYAVVPKGTFHWLAGEALVKHYRIGNGATRSFCSNCGSRLLFDAHAANGAIDVALAIMDGPTGLTPEAHIYTASKAAWFHIDDNLPMYVEGHDLK